MTHSQAILNNWLNFWCRKARLGMRIIRIYAIPLQCTCSFSSCCVYRSPVWRVLCILPKTGIIINQRWTILLPYNYKDLSENVGCLGVQPTVRSRGDRGLDINTELWGNDMKASVVIFLNCEKYNLTANIEMWPVLPSYEFWHCNSYYNVMSRY